MKFLYSIGRMVVRIGLITGFLVFGAMMGVWLFNEAVIEKLSLSPEAWMTAATALLMAVFWVTEALPIFATALLPLVIFPLFQVEEAKVTAHNFSHPLIFLFMGGLILSIVMQKVRLDRRIALFVISLVGAESPCRILLGFMLATAFLSMWMSNTATTLMLMPTALSVVALVRTFLTNSDTVDRFTTSLLLGVGYAATIGGMATLIGTPPNAFFAAYLEKTYDFSVSFVGWMALGVPLALLMGGVTWWVLLLSIPRSFDGSHARQIKSKIQKAREELGTWSREQKMVMGVMLGTVSGWFARPFLGAWLPGINDASIVMLAVLVLFSVPSHWSSMRRILVWEDLEKLPWGILILFGGGMALAGAMHSTGLDLWIGQFASNLGHWPLLLMITTLAMGVIFLTELTSNTATAATLIPVVAAIAIGAELNPLWMMVPVTLAASCAFMLPVATLPNSIVFSSGQVSLRSMMRAGFWLNMAGVVLIPLCCYHLMVYAMNVRVEVMPQWAQQAKPAPINRQ